MLKNTLIIQQVHYTLHRVIRSIIYIYMLAIAGQMAGPNWLNFLGNHWVQSGVTKAEKNRFFN